MRGNALPLPFTFVLNSLQNAKQHTFKIPRNFIVPEAQHAKLSPFKVFRANSVISTGRFLGVLSAIQFNNQSALKANEVGDIKPKWLLTTEFDTQLFASQTRPEQRFFWRSLTAQSSCSFFSFGMSEAQAWRHKADYGSDFVSIAKRDASITPHPSGALRLPPSPARGEGIQGFPNV